MLKRLFWLVLLIGSGALAWLWLRQRLGTYSHTPPHFVPPGTTQPPAAPASTPRDQQAAPQGAAAAAQPLPKTNAGTANATTAGEAFAPLGHVAATPVNGAPAELANVSGYCFRCKAKRVISGAHEEITESGRRAARGHCPLCGTKMFTFLPDRERAV